MLDTVDPQLMRSSASSFGMTESTFVSPCSAAIAQAAAAAQAISGGVDFYLPEFHEYSRVQYEAAGRKRMKGEVEEIGEEQDENQVAEIRRQIHIQSEQKRRAQIKDGFEELRKHLPNCANKKISKAAILSKTIVYLQQLKASHFTLAQELERLQTENERLRGW